jgi:peptide/nickel transport system permease protein
MLQGAYSTASQNYFQIIPPSVMIALTILAFFTLGDGIRDAGGRSSDGR